jgi:chromosome partitioning protein
MQTIAIISQKGGTGKTTLALNLAVAAEMSGRPAAIIDLDPQASAKEWSKSRERETPVVVSAHASQLEEILGAARANGAALTIIDTAPHSERDALAGARAADLILIPRHSRSARHGLNQGARRSCPHPGRRRHQRCAGTRPSGR